MESWYALAMWGLAGGAIIDGLEFWNAVRGNAGMWPVEYRSAAFLIAEGIRLLAGAGLAVAFGISGQVTVPLGALAIGIAAPLIVEKLSAHLPALSTEGK